MFAGARWLLAAVTVSVLAAPTVSAQGTGRITGRVVETSSQGPLTNVSVTVVGTTLGFIGLPHWPVEAIIALSIVFLAVEIVKKKDGEPRLSERVPWVVAFLFGLLHGFGFAGALKEIGLPESDVPTALLTFNLGVEVGQLLIVAATLGLLLALRRLKPNLTRPAIHASSYAIGAIATMWLLERMLL